MFRNAALLALLCTVAAHASDFEVESVKPSQTAATHSSTRVADGGDVSIQNVTVVELLALCWHKREAQLANLPPWARTAQFDIVAKGPPKMNETDVSVRMQSLLAREFKFAAHEEKQPRNAFALVAAKGGPKLISVPGPGMLGCKREIAVDRRVLDCEAITLDNLVTGNLAFAASDYLDRPIVNATRLTSAYRFRLEWVPQAAIDANGGLTVFAALTKQLGLKLEQRKIPIPVLAIDHLERPAEN